MCLPFIYAASHPTARAFYPPSSVIVGRATLKRRFTWTYSLQQVQPDDHPPAGEPLPHLLTLTSQFIMHIMHIHREAVVFFYPRPLSPMASIFRSGAPCAARTFLSHLFQCQRQTGVLLFFNSLCVMHNSDFGCKNTKMWVEMQIFQLFYVLLTTIKGTFARKNSNKFGFSLT